MKTAVISGRLLAEDCCELPHQLDDQVYRTMPEPIVNECHIDQSSEFPSLSYT
jgi:hypothetical protein